MKSLKNKGSIRSGNQSDKMTPTILSELCEGLSIDHEIRKPIQRSEFNDVFSKILLRLHISSDGLSRSYLELPMTASGQ